jgi:hypothetical protein
MERDELLSGYLAGVSTLTLFLGVDDALLRAEPAPGTPSAAEVLARMADDELAAAVGLRTLLAGGPAADVVAPVVPYATARSVPHSVALIVAVRNATVDLLVGLPRTAWDPARSGSSDPVTTWLAADATRFEEALARARRAVLGGS